MAPSASPAAYTPPEVIPPQQGYLETSTGRNCMIDSEDRLACYEGVGNHYSWDITPMLTSVIFHLSSKGMVTDAELSIL